MDEEVLSECVEGSVSTITLNRPDRLNALNPLLMKRLTDAVRRAADDEAVRVVVLTGSGRAFCAGGDRGAMAKAADERVRNAAPKTVSTESRARWLRRCAEASRLLHEMPKPTIAMINGPCAGAGMSLAAACDFRFAAASARFVPAFTANGLSGDYGGSWLWTKILGTARARQLYLNEEPRTAEEALAFGLIDRVFRDDDLRSEVAAIAHRLAGLPGAGLAYAKLNLNAALVEPFTAALDRESLNMTLSRNVLDASRASGK